MGHDRQDRTAIDRRTLLQGAAGLGGSLLLPGIATAQETPRRGGTLRVSMTYNPAALDPMTGRNAPDFNTLMALYDPLIDIDPDTLDPRPGLAQAWTWKDPKSLVLDLRQGVKFHDGTAFDAEVVKFNLDRSRNDARSNLKADMESVDSRRGDRQPSGCRSGSTGPTIHGRRFWPIDRASWCRRHRSRTHRAAMSTARRSAPAPSSS